MNLKFEGDKEPRTLKAFEGFLKTVESRKICKGGPLTSFIPDDVRIKCAQRDNHVWRHKNCPILIDNGSICQKCSNLHATLWEKRLNVNKLV